MVSSELLPRLRAIQPDAAQECANPATVVLYTGTMTRLKGIVLSSNVTEQKKKHNPS